MSDPKPIYDDGNTKVWDVALTEQQIRADHQKNYGGVLGYWPLDPQKGVIDSE